MLLPWGHRRDPPSATNKSEMWSLYMIELGALGFATLFLGLGVMTLVTSLNAVFGADRTTGTVIGFKGYARGDAAPVIRYQVDGKAYELVARLSSRPRDYSRGDTLKIRYHRERPGEGRLESFGELWLFPLIFLACGTIFVTFGVSAWMFGVERKRTAKS